MRMARSRRIVISQSIDQHHLRPSFEDLRNINDVPTGDFQGWNDFMQGQTLLNFGSALRLNGGHNDILATLSTAQAFIKHLRRFSNSRRVSEKNLEMSAL